MKTFPLYSFLLIAFFILSACQKSDKRLTKAIIGNWDKKEFLGCTMGCDPVRYVFRKPNLCTKYSTSSSSSTPLAVVNDSLTFYISDSKLYILKPDATIFEFYNIDKLSSNKLHLYHTPPKGSIAEIEKFIRKL